MTNDQKTKLGTTLAYILERLKEPSTIVAIGVFVGFFGVSDETFNRITANLPSIIAALTVLAGVLLPSRGSKALAEVREAKATAADAGTVAGDGLL